MEMALQILNYIMWFFIAFFLVVGILSLVWNNKNERRTWSICTIIVACLVFAISVVRLFIAIELEKPLVEFIVYLPVWLYATFIQLIIVKRNSE